MLQEPPVKFATRPSVPFEQLKIKAAFSLNDTTHFKSGGQQGMPAVAEAPAVQVLNKEVTEENAKAAILNYAETKQNEGSRQIATILKTAGITFSGGTITLTLNNETQKEQLLLIKQAFMDALRQELQNSAVQLEITLSEHEVQTKAYKPADIFKAMADKNPALLELKKRFDLEIDY